MLLDNIKSLFITKQIFSCLNMLIKLKICQINKRIQSKININLFNYKILSRRYIINETEEDTKEYDRFYDKIVFKGEYLNGKRNGKGKEYNFDGTVIFEGEYLNGKRNGMGKEYFDDGNLKFEGEYFSGKKWTGKGYDKNNIVIYKLEKEKDM